MKQDTWIRHLLAAVLTLTLVGCVEEVPVDNAACPCSEGWTCCEGEGVCVLDGEACPQVCGNGTVEPPETCDNGDDNGDTTGCTSACQVATCGDGLVNAGVEACDDTGESASCNSDCTLATCGDGIINATAGEVCDDSNSQAGDYCAQDCSAITGRCGDGITQQNEACDAGDNPTLTCPTVS